MKKLLTLTVLLLLLLTVTSCRRYIYRPPVQRPVEFVPDSMVHDDMPKADDENRDMLEEIENEPVISVPDIPKESDLLQDKNSDVDVEKIMRDGI